MTEKMRIERLNGANGHEQVYHVFDEISGLNAFIAIHSTVLGPACGGCRVWSYDSPSDGQKDVMRLSRGMTYKNALAGVKFGGGKSVVLGPIPNDKREVVFSAFGKAIETLGGDYITAEDVGVSVADMELVHGETKYVSGLRDRGMGIGGDPSPFTARGVMRGIEAAVKHKFGRDDLDGLKIAVQGLGAVGEKLCRGLMLKGARLIVSDINVTRALQFCDLTDATYRKPDNILLADADIIVPCALGGAITEHVASNMHGKVIAGAANNQLATDLVGAILRERDILYAPDYVINGGGIIMAEAEYYQSDNADGVNARIDGIYDRTLRILERAVSEDRPPHLVADRMAEEIIAEARARASA